MKILFYGILLLSLSSCSTLSKKECEDITWQNEGYKSALKGERAGSEISRFKKLCTDEHNVAINSDNFTSGYKQGLEKYCSKSNLYEKGLNGEEYQGICDATAAPEVKTSFVDGRVKFLEKRVSDLEYEIYRLKNANSDLESKINSCSHL